MPQIPAGLTRRDLLAALGAAGDGRADDTHPLQKAIDASGSVWLPRGRYRLTAPLVVDLARVGPASITGDGTATLIMEGEGPAIHLRGTHRKSADPGDVAEAVWLKERAPMLSGFEILGTHAKADGILAEGTMQAVFTRLLVRRVRHGLRLETTNRNVVISDSHFYHNHGAGVLLERANLHQINITNCHISYNGGGGVVVRASEVRNLQIGSSDLEANMAPNGPPAANILLDARSGAIREGSITGCTLQHTAAAPGSANILFVGAGAAANQKVGYFSIAGNTITDARVNLDLAYARGVSITGNTLALGTEYNVRIVGSAGVILGPNVMDQNPDYKPAASRNGILLDNCTDCLLEGFAVRDGGPAEAAVTLRGCRRCRVSGISIVDSAKMAVLIEDAEQVAVTGCLFQGSWPVALRLRGGHGNRVADNQSSGELDIAESASRIKGSDSSRIRP